MLFKVIIEAYNFLDSFKLNEFVKEDYYDLDLNDFENITNSIRTIVKTVRDKFLGKFPEINSFQNNQNFDEEMPDYVKSKFTSKENLKNIIDNTFYLAKLEIFESIFESSKESVL